MRRNEFILNDLAYTCDIDALHKKIDGMHEQIEKNDTTLASLEKLKNNMINMDNLLSKEEADNKYRSKSDLTYKEAIDIPYENRFE